MLLESGPAKTLKSDRNYFLIFTIICFGIGLYFFYDWKIGYPKKVHEVGLETLTNQLKLSPEDAEKVLANDSITEDTITLLRNNPPKTREALQKALGKPFSVPGDTSGLERYGSKYGYVDVYLKPGRIEVQEWQEWYKTKAEIDAQWKWGMFPMLIGLFGLYRFLKAIVVRAKLDETNFTYGKTTIPYSAITEFANFNPKGYVDVCYEVAGQTKRIHLDNLKVDQYDEIINLISEKAGIENPLASRPSQDDDVEESDNDEQENT